MNIGGVLTSLVSFVTGKMCLCRVMNIARRRPPKDELDNANPVRNDETGLWQCPFCLQDDFPELSEVSTETILGSLNSGENYLLQEGN